VARTESRMRALQRDPTTIYEIPILSQSIIFQFFLKSSKISFPKVKIVYTPRYLSIRTLLCSTIHPTLLSSLLHYLGRDTYTSPTNSLTPSSYPYTLSGFVNL
jgi:hypothetical protein